MDKYAILRHFMNSPKGAFEDTYNPAARYLKPAPPGQGLLAQFLPKAPNPQVDSVNQPGAPQPGAPQPGAPQPGASDPAPAAQPFGLRKLASVVAPNTTSFVKAARSKSGSVL